MKEALRYLNNAKETLRKASIEENRYADTKYVQKACGVAYLAVLKAIDEYLLKKGLSRKELPKSVDTYRKALEKYLKVHDGKLSKEFEAIYDELHIAGYYRGNLHSVEVVRGALNSARAFIEKIGKWNSSYIQRH